ncbi:ankyrin repeat domain-containing protein [Vibrio hepatarius]|uniref:ankyrin repeat domain-containing protein n=1 Tax=Vibrio hepatarius TaxID=171383 RepID=UPI001C08C9B6|nr:ankyrin repeat domain-containing protein [Vibrio hepatarius]MBU2899302.1 ankyrin repeat domain-containing protein [Vibrio hepatarius]
MNDLIEQCQRNKGSVTLFNLFFDPIKTLDNQESELFIDMINNKKLSNIRDSIDNNLLHYSLMINSPLSDFIAKRFPSFINQKNKLGQLPCHFGAFHNNLDLSKFSPQQSSRQDSRGFTPLHIAAELGNQNHIKSMLASVEEKNIFNAFALHWALKNDERNSIKRVNKLIFSKALLQTAKSVQMKTRNAIGMTPRDWMEATCSTKEIDFIMFK